MRAGKLTTKRYKVGRRGGGWLLLLIGAALGAGVLGLIRGEWAFSLPIVLPIASPQPAATWAPEDMAASEMTVTLPGRVWYALQLGAFEQEASASALAETYRGRGAGGYVLWDGSFRVLAAAYPTRAGAQAVGNQLRTGYQVDTVITELIRPEIILRLTGRQAQLTALKDAYDALDALPEQLNALTDRLDRGEAANDALLSALSSQRDTLSALADRLEGLFGENAPAAAAGAENLCRKLVSSLDKALAVKGKTALGAAIRYAALQSLCGAADYTASLTSR